MTYLLYEFLSLMTQAADPQLLGGVDVSDHYSLLGARTADHRATFSAVVSTLGHRELVRAAHADCRGLAGDAGSGEDGHDSGTAGLQQFGLAVHYVFYPGLLLLVGGSCYVEGLVRCMDQPLVSHSIIIL